MQYNHLSFIGIISKQKCRFTHFNTEWCHLHWLNEARTILFTIPRKVDAKYFEEISFLDCFYKNINFTFYPYFQLKLICKLCIDVLNNMINNAVIFRFYVRLQKEAYHAGISYSLCFNLTLYRGLYGNGRYDITYRIVDCGSIEIKKLK